MKLHLIAVGHKMPGWVNAGYEDYARRMPPDLPLVLTEIKPGHRVAGEGGARARELAAQLPPGVHRDAPAGLPDALRAEARAAAERTDRETTNAYERDALVPTAADIVRTIDPRGDIEDPIGGDTALYHALALQLQSLIEQRIEEKDREIAANVVQLPFYRRK